jgi:hypothetical protein
LRPRHDISDFLGFLREHEGSHVAVELGRRATDPDGRDRILAVLDGTLGIWEMVNDGQCGVAWVPVGTAEDSPSGFCVRAHRAVEVLIDEVGGNVLFDDKHYVAVVPRMRARQ